MTTVHIITQKSVVGTTLLAKYKYLMHGQTWPTPKGKSKQSQCTILGLPAVVSLRGTLPQNKK